MKPRVYLGLFLAFVVATLNALAEHTNLGSTNLRYPYSPSAGSDPADVCALFRPGSPVKTVAPPLLPPGFDPQRQREGQRRTEALCAQNCPTPEKGASLVACTFTATWDDMLSTRTRAATSECIAFKEICAEFRNEESIVSPAGGSGAPLRVTSGTPDDIKRSGCATIVAPDKKECALIPASTDPNCTGTQGGPLTYFFDKGLNRCVSYQNLGSCDARGPFGSLIDCAKALSDRRCR